MSTIHVPPQFPTLPPPVKIAFVGEAPSTMEIERGIPLVGPSGRIFDAMLRTAGLERSEYLVTNVFDEKLPGNDVVNWCLPMKEAREQGLTDLPPLGKSGFLRQEHRWHLERLSDELHTWRPNVIVPLGGTALWAFTGDTSISSQRGTVLASSRIVNGAKLVPTFHPAHVMHQWKFFSVVVGDFMKAAREAELGPQIILPKKELFLEPTIKEFQDYAPKLFTSDMLSVDIETGWGQITCIGFAPNASEAICVPFVDKRKPNRSYWVSEEDEIAAWGIVRDIMHHPVPKLGQNFAGYDAYWFLKKMGIEPRNLKHDTRLMHHALYPELPKDLEFLGASYTQQGAWKSWGRRKKEKRDD